MPTVCVVTYENRELNFKESFRRNHRAYCDKHGYEYKAYDAVEYNVPHYWTKVFLVKDLLEKYDYVMWIDSDAMFETEEPIECGESFFVISKDKPQHRIPAPMNTGVFIVKNCTLGKQFMEEWGNSYNPKRWKKTPDNKWLCVGQWSGDDYEQGSCVMLLQKQCYKGHTVVDWHVLNNHFYSGFKGRVMHFCGSFGKRMFRKALRGGSLSLQ